jgi:hypothetical protein
MTKQPDPETVGTSSLSEAERAELERLKAAWETGGDEALSKAQKQLRQTDPVLWFKIVRTYYPHLLRRIIGDGE